MGESDLPKPGTAVPGVVRVFPQTMGALAVAAGALVLLGWAADLAALKSVIPGLATMKANTALGVFACGASLWAASRVRPGPVVARVGVISAWFALLLGGATLFECGSGIDLGIDELLFTDHASRAAGLSPGRMSDATATCLSLLGLALLVARSRVRRPRVLSEALSALVMAIAFLVVLGYLFGVASLYGVWFFSTVAIHTALLLLGLALGTAMLHPEEGWLAEVLAPTAGGSMARALLLAAIPLPVLLAYVRLQGQKLELYGTEFGLGIMVFFTVALLTAAILWNARRLNRADVERLSTMEGLRALNASLQAARREAEESLARLLAAQADLEKSERMFRELAESIEEAFWVTRQGPRPFDYISPAFERIWGRTREELTGTKGLWANSIHPEDRQRVLRSIQEKEEVGGYEETYRIVRPDGSVRWVRDRAFPVRDASGKILRIFGVAEDVTERRRLEEQFLQSQKMEAVGRLAAGVAHDFNNLLTVILGYSDMARTELPGDVPASGYLREVVEASHRAGALTKQLLTFGRKSAYLPVSVDLNSAVHAALTMLKRLAGPEVEFVVDLDPGMGTVQADPGQVDQVLLNLVVNAKHAMPTGGKITIESREVTLEAESAPAFHRLPPGRYARIRVTDTGSGMTEEVRSHVFEPFFTTKAKGEGTGLGLATVFGIAKQAGGEVRVYSEPGQGATFVLYFPVERDKGARAAAAPPEPAHAERTLRVLVVDDERAVREFVAGALAADGHVVVPAANAEEAEAAWKAAAASFDLIVTDIGLPRMSGISLAQRLGKEGASTPVLFISGYSEVTASGALSIPEGAHYLAKPFASAELRKAIREAMGWGT